MDNVSKSNRLIKSHDMLVCLGIVVIFFMFLLITGTITSGYHFTDDHGIISIQQELEITPFYQTLINIIKGDMSIRFRPVYFLHRVFETKIFGTNFLIWSIYTAFLGCIVCVVFYLGMRKLDHSIFESILFVVLMFVGPQMSIWWRLGPAETIGMVFLSLAFFFMCGNMSMLSNVLFCIFLILSSWCKESFTVVIPGLIYLRIYLEFHRKSDLGIKNIIARNAFLAIPLIVMIFNVIIIIYYVGINNIGYAGLDNNASGILISLMLFPLRSKVFSYYALLFFTFIGFILLSKKRNAILILKRIMPIFIFLVLISFPSIVLYAKSGMNERYLLPYLLGVAFFSISLFQVIWTSDVKCHKILTTLVLISILPLAVFAFYRAVKFSSEGRETESMFHYVKRELKEYSNVLCVVDPYIDYERTFSLDKYFEYNMKITPTYYAQGNIPLSSDFARGLSEGWYSKYKNRLFNRNIIYDIIVFSNNTNAGTFFDEYPELKEIYILANAGSFFPVYLKNIS
jgi:hypothetical protein